MHVILKVGLVTWCQFSQNFFLLLNKNYFFYDWVLRLKPSLKSIHADIIMDLFYETFSINLQDRDLSPEEMDKVIMFS